MFIQQVSKVSGASCRIVGSHSSTYPHYRHDHQLSPKTPNPLETLGFTALSRITPLIQT